MLMMVGGVLDMVGVIVVVGVVDQDQHQHQLADLSSTFCSSFTNLDHDLHMDCK